MDQTETDGRRERLVRTTLAAALAVVAVAALRKGKRLTGVLAGVGALALGYATTRAPSGSDAFDTEAMDDGFGTAETGEAATREMVTSETATSKTTTDDSELRCAICGQPIRPGQRRGPNEEGDTVHDDCKVAAE